MSIIVNLRKDVDVVLQKRGVPNNVKVQAGLSIDVSGSMSSLYSKGIVQETVTRLLAVASRFDDNGEMDMWSFCDEFNRLAPVNEQDFSTYVEKEIINNKKVSKWSGTQYAGVLNDIKAYYFGSDKPTGLIGGLFGKNKKAVSSSKLPVLINFVVDGGCNDTEKVVDFFDNMTSPLYVNFVGIGSANFSFIDFIADKYSNVGFVKISDLSQLTPEELYTAILTEELSEWLKATA